MRSLLCLLIALAVAGSAAHAQKAASGEEQAVRSVIEKWDAGYRSLDAKAMAAAADDRYELVDRFGQRTAVESLEEYEKMWAWTFANVYRGKPGPRHVIENVRFIARDAALVQATAKWLEPIVLPDGKTIPPFTQHATFVLVKKGKQWKITSHNVHNRFVDPSDAHTPGTRPWLTGTGR